MYDIQKMFNQFLFDNNCYNEFCRNLYKQKFKCIKTFVNNNNEYNIIDKGFAWDSTIECFSFWENLNEKWNKYITEKLSSNF